MPAPPSPMNLVLASRWCILASKGQVVSVLEGPQGQSGESAFPMWCIQLQGLDRFGARCRPRGPGQTTWCGSSDYRLVLLPVAVGYSPDPALCDYVGRGCYLAQDALEGCSLVRSLLPLDSDVGA